MEHAPRPTRSPRTWLPLALLSASLLFLLIASIPPLIRVLHVTPSPAPAKGIEEYTFLGDDYPSYLPLNLEQVSLTPENTVHYRIYTEDAEREWDSVFPDGGGFLFLGLDQRPFTITLFHQMHCLVRIRRAISTGQSSAHVHHCFNYLRQTILCEADSTLEPVLPDVGGKKVIGGSAHVCKDWAQVYKMAAENYQKARKNGVGR